MTYPLRWEVLQKEIEQTRKIIIIVIEMFFFVWKIKKQVELQIDCPGRTIGLQYIRIFIVHIYFFKFYIEYIKHMEMLRFQRAKKM